MSYKPKIRHASPAALAVLAEMKERKAQKRKPNVYNMRQSLIKMMGKERADLLQKLKAIEETIEWIKFTKLFNDQP